MEDEIEIKPLISGGESDIKERHGPHLGQFLSLKKKSEILKRLSDGTKQCQLAKEYNIAASTISRLKKYRKTIQKAMTKYRNDTNRRSLRGTYHPKMENALHKWYLEQTKAGVAMTTNMIRMKARELYTKIRENNLDFQASPGWLEKFKRRYGIQLKGAYKKRKLIENETDSSAGEQEIVQNNGVNIKTEHPFETTFVDVSSNNCDENFKVEQQLGAKGQKPHDIIQCMDEVIQWTANNQIEPIYLTMLRSLRDRIQNR